MSISHDDERPARKRRWWPHTPLLDRSWGRDAVWERGVVDAIRRGAAAPRALSIGALVSGPYDPNGGFNGGGWEHAEQHAKGAIRTGAVFLNDEAIARREAERKQRRAALAEAEAENRRRVQARKREEAARPAEREKQDRIYRERVDEAVRKRAEQDIEWAKAQTAAHERAAQARAILRHGWLCADCRQRAAIWPERGGFSLGCPFCGSRAWGSHEEALAIMEGR
jgi:hypothetical protein